MVPWQRQLILIKFRDQKRQEEEARRQQTGGVDLMREPLPGEAYGVSDVDKMGPRAKEIFAKRARYVEREKKANPPPSPARSRRKEPGVKEAK